MSKVFVVDSQGTPLLPTNPVRARRLLKQGKARVKQVVPFTIQLKREIKNPVGTFEVGVDDGAKYVGVAIKNRVTDEIVFHGQLNHRLDVSLQVSKRRDYRKARRYRLKYREPRFNNRIGHKIAPSIRQRKEAIIRVIRDFSKRLALIKVKVEEVSFNHARFKWGKFFSLVEIGKKYLKEQIQNLGLIYETTFGFFTKDSRLTLGLSKSHSHDACSILNSHKICGFKYFIKPRRAKIWESNPTKKCLEKNGLKHYDLVTAHNRVQGKVVGSIRSLMGKNITLRTKNNNNFPVAYSKTKLLQRFKGLIYSY